MSRRRYKPRLLNVPELRSGALRLAVTGFHGFGAVGYLATHYMVTKLPMKLVGYFEPPTVPDFTSLEDYGLSMPHEIFYYGGSGAELVVILNRVNPDRRHLGSYVASFIEVVQKLGVSEVVLVGGLDLRFREGQEEYRWLKNSHSNRALGAPIFIKGAYIIGPLAALLLALERHGVPAVALFPYTEPESVDHRAAAVALRLISEMAGVVIDVGDLIRYAERVEELEKVVQRLQAAEMKRESLMHM